jgi:hypothetical protein
VRSNTLYNARPPFSPDRSIGICLLYEATKRSDLLDRMKTMTKKSQTKKLHDLPLHALSLPKCCEYIPRFFQKVMYHINPAVIKSILASMPKEEFYRHARYIHSQSLSLPEGTNRQAMFFNLWQWCLRLHRERFGG